MKTRKMGNSEVEVRDTKLARLETTPENEDGENDVEVLKALNNKKVNKNVVRNIAKVIKIPLVQETETPKAEISTVSEVDTLKPQKETIDTGTDSDSSDDEEFLPHEKLETRYFTPENVRVLIHHNEKPFNVIADCYDSETIYRHKEDYASFNLPTKKKSKTNSCFICFQPQKPEELNQKCLQKGCESSFHEDCMTSMNSRGYTAFHAKTNQGIVCPLHFCQKCFADGLHQRCFRFEELISCSHCEIKFHPNCIPAGCAINEKTQTIICPRHCLATKFTHRPKDHCFECNDSKNSDHPLIDCSNCNRSFHSKCHSFYAYRQNNPLGERCSFCIKCNFIVPGQYVYAQYDSYQYHLGIAIKNEEYPVDKQRNNIKCGFYAIQWIEGKDSKRCSIVSHYRTLPFTENIWFHKHRMSFPLLKKIYDYESIYSQIKKVQFEIQPAPEELSSAKFSRNNAIKNIDFNRYMDDEIRKDIRESNRKNHKVRDLCVCNENEPNRCGYDDCVNKNIYLECPKACEIVPGGCNNRLIANKSNMFKDLEIFYTSHRGYGLRSKVDIPMGAYIGEYCGEVITDKEKRQRDRNNIKWKSRDTAFYTMALGKYYYLDAELYGSIMRYVNHACDPNCVTQIYVSANCDAHVCLFAAKNISAGEELTFSYSSNHHDNNLSFKCYCGSSNCSGVFKA